MIKTINQLSMSVLDRLDKIREDQGLNKGEFERAIGKSIGYLNTLKRQNSLPSIDVLIQLLDNYPKYNMDWLMTGEGSMYKSDFINQVNESVATYRSPADNTVMLAVRDDIKKDLGELSVGVTKNFETLSHGIMRLLQDQQKILKFIDTINAEKISAASAKLDDFLNKVNDN